MIDIDKAKKRFEKYVSQYDLNNDKIRLKMIHTYCVVETSKYIVIHEQLSQEDYQLSLLIALLHDIGRFEQLKQFNSFSDQNVDHALLGVKILFEDNLIREFIDTDQYDQIIKSAIQYHSLYQLPVIKDQKILLHAKLIRDSDKLDNFRVKNIESIETLFDISEENFVNQLVSDNIIDDIKKHHLILSSNRKNEVDMWVSYFAFVFDLNFNASFQYLKETQYIRKNIDRFVYNPLLKKQMEFVKNECNQYVLNHL